MSVLPEDRSRRIRARMQSLRTELEQDAARITRNANELLSWKDYVKRFPTGALAFAVVAGFLLVPGRKVIKSVKLTEGTIQNLVEQQNLATTNTATKDSPLTAGLFRVLTGVAVNGLAGIAQRSVDHFMGGRRGVNGTQTIRSGDRT